MAILARKKVTLTRAEQLRQRRAKTADQPRMPVARSTVAGASTAGTLWEPRVRRVAPRAHRRIRLDEPGVEVQIPAVSVSFSARALAVLLAAAAGGALLFLLTSAMFLTGLPTVSGAALVPVDAVISAAGAEGANLFLLSPEEIAGRITGRIPGVKQAAVTVDLYGAVDIQIAERAPILLWSQDGQEYWVDADGVVFPVTKPMDGLVRVDVAGEGAAIALDGMNDVDPQLVINALELAVSIPQGSRIIYDVAHGLGMVEASGLSVYFGTSGRIEQKMEIYRRLAQRFMARGIRPSLVDVQDIWQPFYLR